MQSDKGYHKLVIWQKLRLLILAIYQLTEQFPKSEMFGLSSQLRRATISVLLNIVEGDRRKSSKEYLRFLDVADGSLAEVEACLEIALDLGYITDKQYSIIEIQRKEIAFMLQGLIRAIQKKL